MEKIDLAKEIMTTAGRDVLGGFKVDVGVDQLLTGNSARYSDKRPMARKLWKTMMDALETVGAVPKRDVA